MIVRRSRESIGQKLRPSVLERVRGPTTPATFATFSSVSALLPRGTTNCCMGSGSDVGRFTPGPEPGSAVVFDAAEGVGWLATGALPVCEPAPSFARSPSGTPEANTPAATPEMTLSIAAPTSQPGLRLGAVSLGGGGVRSAVGSVTASGIPARTNASHNLRSWLYSQLAGYVTRTDAGTSRSSLVADPTMPRSVTAKDFT
jgi:hypothetical protein